MKKLVEVVLAENDSGVLFSLGESVSGRLDTNGALNIIQKDSYLELMKGDGVSGRKGYIIIVTEEEYTDFKKQNKID